MYLRFLILLSTAICLLTPGVRAQPSSGATGTALVVNKSTGLILGPVSASTFKTANSIGTGSGGSGVLEGLVADWNGTTGTDNSPVIQAALNAGTKYIVLGSGSYKIATKIDVPPGTTITGQGTAATNLHYTGTAYAFENYADSSADLLKDSRILNLTVYGTASAGLIDVSDIYRMEVSNVSLRGTPGNAIRLNNIVDWTEGFRSFGVMVRDCGTAVKMEVNGGTNSFAELNIHDISIVMTTVGSVGFDLGANGYVYGHRINGKINVEVPAASTPTDTKSILVKLGSAATWEDGAFEFLQELGQDRNFTRYSLAANARFGGFGYFITQPATTMTLNLNGTHPLDSLHSSSVLWVAPTGHLLPKPGVLGSAVRLGPGGSTFAQVTATSNTTTPVLGLASGLVDLTLNYSGTARSHTLHLLVDASAGGSTPLVTVLSNRAQGSSVFDPTDLPRISRSTVNGNSYLYATLINTVGDGVMTAIATLRTYETNLGTSDFGTQKPFVLFPDMTGISVGSPVALARSPIAPTGTPIDPAADVKLILSAADYATIRTLLSLGTGNSPTFAGLTSTGLVTTPASTTGSAGVRLPHGSAPTSPTNGDVWTTTAGIYVRVNGTTVGPLSTGGGTSYTFNSPLSESAGAVSIANAAADGSTKGAATFNANDFNATSGVITIDYANGQAASTSAKGLLTSSDWDLFNGKLASASIDTSAELRSIVTDETGTGALVFGTDPLLLSPNADMGALAVDVTKKRNTKSISADSTLTFSATATAGATFGLVLTNSDSAAHTITIPSSYSQTILATRTSFTIPGSSSVELSWTYDGTTYSLAGEPYTINDLTAATAATGDSVPGYDTSAGADKKFLISEILALGIDDTAYDSTSWNGDTTKAPSKDAVRDKIAALAQADISGLTTADSPQFTGVNVGNASDTTVTRASAGDIAVEGNRVYRVGGSFAGTPDVWVIPIGDETTAITTGTAKVTFRAPYAATVTAVRASLTTVSSSGTPTFDINEGGTTILSTNLTVDASEKTSTTAATAAVISDTALADDAEITIDVDTAGTGAAGAKISIYVTR